MLFVRTVTSCGLGVLAMPEVTPNSPREESCSSAGLACGPCLLPGHPCLPLSPVHPSRGAHGASRFAGKAFWGLSRELSPHPSQSIVSSSLSRSSVKMKPCWDPCQLGPGQSQFAVVEALGLSPGCCPACLGVGFLGTGRRRREDQ